MVIHLTLIPYLKAAKELKTKPTQHSVKELLEAGIQPDILVCRTEMPLPMDIRKKLALFCNVHLNSVIEAMDAETIYDVPILMRKEKLDERVLAKLKVQSKEEPHLENWKTFLGKLKNPVNEVNIGFGGKICFVTGRIQIYCRSICACRDGARLQSEFKMDLFRRGD